MKVRNYFFRKINAFMMTDWKAQGFFKTMGNKDFRNFIYIDSRIAKPYLYDSCLKCDVRFDLSQKRKGLVVEYMYSNQEKYLPCVCLSDCVNKS